MKMVEYRIRHGRRFVRELGENVALRFEVEGTPCVSSTFGVEIKIVATGCQILRLKFI